MYSGVKVSEYFIIGFFLENHILNFNLKLKVSFMKTKTLLWPHDEKSLKEEMFDLCEEKGGELPRFHLFISQTDIE